MIISIEIISMNEWTLKIHVTVTQKRNHFFIASSRRMEITNIHFAIQSEIKIFPKRIEKTLTKNKA